MTFSESIITNITAGQTLALYGGYKSAGGVPKTLSILSVTITVTNNMSN